MDVPGINSKAIFVKYCRILQHEQAAAVRRQLSGLLHGLPETGAAVASAVALTKPLLYPGQ
jgi:hypothetical protein